MLGQGGITAHARQPRPDADPFIFTLEWEPTQWHTMHRPQIGPAPLLLESYRRACKFAGEGEIPVGTVPLRPTPRSGVPSDWVAAVRLADLVRLLTGPNGPKRGSRHMPIWATQWDS